MSNNYNKVAIESVMTPIPLETADVTNNIYDITEKMNQKRWLYNNNRKRSSCRNNYRKRYSQKGSE
jgi:hypothetical protein